MVEAGPLISDTLPLSAIDPSGEVSPDAGGPSREFPGNRSALPAGFLQSEVPDSGEPARCAAGGASLPSREGRKASEASCDGVLARGDVGVALGATRVLQGSPFPPSSALKYLQTFPKLLLVSCRLIGAPPILLPDRPSFIAG